jgi:hypothetical protein
MPCLYYYGAECDCCCVGELRGHRIGVVECEFWMADGERSGWKVKEGVEREGKGMVEGLEVGFLEVEGCLD